MTGFEITAGKGFRVTFANGWAVSVQFGYGNYGDNFNRLDPIDGRGFCASSRAETALIDPKGEFIHIEGTSVQGYQTPDQVLALMAFAAVQPAG